MKKEASSVFNVVFICIFDAYASQSLSLFLLALSCLLPANLHHVVLVQIDNLIERGTIVSLDLFEVD